MIKEILKDNMITIVTYIYMFLVGVGIGAAVTDMINEIGEKKNEKHNDSDT